MLFVMKPMLIYWYIARSIVRATCVVDSLESIRSSVIFVNIQSLIVGQNEGATLL